MTSVPIKIEVDGKPEFERTFYRLDARIKDMRPVWDEDVKPEFFQIEREQFRSEGSAGRSGRWKPLSTEYAARKLKLYGAKPILERTGRLMRSMTSETSDTYYKSTQMGVEIGTRVPYAGFHHRGSGNNPKREVISFSEMQKKRLAKRIQKGLIREIGRGNVYREDR